MDVPCFSFTSMVEAGGLPATGFTCQAEKTGSALWVRNAEGRPLMPDSGKLPASDRRLLRQGSAVGHSGSY